MSRSFLAASIALGLGLQASAAWAADQPPAQVPVATASAQGFGQGPVTLTASQRQALVQHLIDDKPDPGVYAAASALLPGAGEIALGDWQEPAIVWGALLLASAGVYALKTHTIGIHPAFLATTPYVLANQVSIPNVTPADDPNDFFNRFLQIAYLGAAAWTGYRSYQLAEQQRAKIDKLAQPLHP